MNWIRSCFSFGDLWQFVQLDISRSGGELTAFNSAKNFPQVSFQLGGWPVFLPGFDRVDFEAAAQRIAHFLGIKEHSPADLVDGEVAVRHPLMECAFTGCRLRVGEYDFSASFDPD